MGTLARLIQAQSPQVSFDTVANGPRLPRPSLPDEKVVIRAGRFAPLGFPGDEAT